MKYTDLTEVQQQELLMQVRNISLEIPADVLPLWHKDYENMRGSMIYGKSVSFDELLTEIRQLNARIRQLPYTK